MKSFIRIIVFIAVLHIAVFVGYGLFNNPKDCNPGVPGNRMLVVFGNTVYPNGQVSPVLKGRLDRALDAYKAGCYTKILVSGGYGDEMVYEGTAMSEYLKSKGINADEIFIDNNGNDSYRTAIYTKQILVEQGDREVTVVTSYYHVVRAMFAMKLVGVTNVDGIGSRYIAYQDVIKIPRDIVAFYAYALKYGFELNINLGN